MTKNLITGVLLLAIGAMAGYAYIQFNKQSSHGNHNVELTHDKMHGVELNGVEFCVEHQIAESECPWCDRSLISKLGHCAEHDVPEALCSQCKPALIAGFKAENDWCAEHRLPESQCAICLAQADHDSSE